MSELNVESIFKLKVEELKQELAKRNLPKGGSKADLVERLLQHVTSKLYDANDSVLDEPLIPSEADVRLEGSLEAALVDHEADSTEKVKGHDLDRTEESIDNHGTSDTEQAEIVDSGADILDDEFISIHEPHNDTSASNNKNAATVDEFQTVGQTADVHTSVSIGCDGIVDEPVSCGLSKPKFCRVTITSPMVSDKQKKEDRSKRFCNTDEVDKKRARLGSISSKSMDGGETFVANDLEKIKKRVERFGPVSSVLTPNKLHSRKERFADPVIRKRQERFGTTTSSSFNLASDMEGLKQSRLAKFGAV